MIRKKPTDSKAPVSKIKLAFAALGVFFCIVFVVKMVSAVMSGPVHRGPSELALNPDKQNEILAERKARELQEVLGLSEEQTAEISAIIATAKGSASEIMRKNKGDVGGLVKSAIAKRREATDQIRSVLTEEQRAQFDDLVKDQTKHTDNTMKEARKKHRRR